MAEKEVAALSDPQLRERLAAFPGQDVPPITASTRKALERRLLKLMSSPVSAKAPVVFKASPLAQPKAPTFVVDPQRVPAAKRTPSPTIAPLPRTVKPSTPIGKTRTGAAFSSDEEEDSVDAGDKLAKRKLRSADATGNTSIDWSIDWLIGFPSTVFPIDWLIDWLVFHYCVID